MKILKLHNDWNRTEETKKNNSYGGCGYYRTLKVAEQLSPEHEVTVWGREWSDTAKEYATVENFYDSIFSQYDIVWTHYTDNEVLFSWMYVAAQKHDVKLVMDIDDNFFDVHKSNPAYKAISKGKRRKYTLATILAHCDALTVSTIPLKEKLVEHIKTVHNIDIPVFVVPNYNDVTDWNFPPTKRGENVTIGYMGSVSHDDDFFMVMPAIKTILEKYPKVVFQLMGQFTHTKAHKVFKGWSNELKDRVYMINPTSQFSDFPFWLSLQPWDIGIAPLIESDFNKCKSHIKWMEYSMFGITTVASKVYPYYKDILGKETIVDGETGLLCKEGEWVEKLSKLIDNKELREKLAKNAYDTIVKNWQYKDAKQHILKVVEQIKEVPKSSW